MGGGEKRDSMTMMARSRVLMRVLYQEGAKGKWWEKEGMRKAERPGREEGRGGGEWECKKRIVVASRYLKLGVVMLALRS